jgi:hypothetical protein
MLVLVFLTASCLIVPSPANAEPKTLVVPDDYQTISSAIGNATAGDTIFVKKGTYEGPINQTIVIDKTLSIVGENAENTIIKLHPAYNVTYVYNANIIQYSDSMIINANSVSLINLTLKFKGAIRANGDRLQIIGNTISSPTMDVFHIKGANCIFAKNFVLVSVNLEGSSNTLRQNILDAWSLSLQSANCNVIESNAFNSNLYLNSSHNNTFYHNNFLNNSRYTGVGVRTGSFNFWDNGEEGNFWGDYNGTDANGDGIGDTPYVIDGANVDNYPLMFPYDVENDTVVLPPSEPFPTILVASALVIVAVFGVGLIVYFKKRKR